MQHILGRIFCERANRRRKTTSEVSAKTLQAGEVFEMKMMSSCWRERTIRPAVFVVLAGIVAVLLFSAACGSGGSGSSPNSAPAGSGGTGSSGSQSVAPNRRSRTHLWQFCRWRTQDFQQVIGDTTDAPFLNSLINYQGSNPSAPGALVTNYFADAHPSIGNYFMMTTGQLVTTDDTFNLTSRRLSGDSR